MDEIMRIADRATILRDGRTVTTAPLAELSLEAIIGHIIGRRARGFSDLVRHDAVVGEPLLELEGATGVHKPREATLAVHRGEVVGVAGLLGSGRSSLARLIFGLETLVVGAIRVRGRPVAIRSPADAIASGIALVPEDRSRQGLVVQHSVASNIALPVLDGLSRWSWLPPGRAERLAERQIAALRIRTASSAAAVRTLSGGNQQKVVVAKWLAAEPEILVLDEPTAGIDIGSKAEIIALIRDLARQGKGILLISSELTELLAASDRILVMSEGRIVQSLPREALGGGEESAEPQAAEHRLQMAVQQAHLNG
jgi:ribose transport system ATP-binding protein